MNKQFRKRGIAPILPLIVVGVILISVIVLSFFYNKDSQDFRPRAQTAHQVACCRDDPNPYDCIAAGHPAGTKEIRFVGLYYYNCDSPNNSYGYVSHCNPQSFRGFKCITPTVPPPPPPPPLNPPPPTSGFNCVSQPCSTWTTNTTGTYYAKVKTGTFFLNDPNPFYKDKNSCMNDVSSLNGVNDPMKLNVCIVPRVIPLAQACRRQGQETYQVKEYRCDETNNIISQCMGNDVWVPLGALCGERKCTNEPTSYTYRCLAPAETLVQNNNGYFQINIALVPENYPDYNSFKSDAKIAADKIIARAGLEAKYVNIYIVNEYNQTYHTNSGSFDLSKINNMGAKLIGADYAILIENPNSCHNYPGGNYVWGFAAVACGPSNAAESMPSPMHIFPFIADFF